MEIYKRWQTKTKERLCSSFGIFGYFLFVRDGNRDRSGNECANQDSLWHGMGYSRWRDEAEKGVCQSSASEQSLTANTQETVTLESKNPKLIFLFNSV